MMTDGESETTKTPSPPSGKMTTGIIFLTVTMGSLILLASTTTEMAYLYVFRDNFSSRALFMIYSAFCGLKLAIPIFMIAISIIRMMGKD